METLNSTLVLLTIDDEEAVRSSIAAFFEDCGFSVIQACDGREGIDMARTMRPDVVITDLRMPNVDGLEVVDAVCRMDDNMPVIVLSGTGVLDDAIQALRRGAWDYLAKPVLNLIELEYVVTHCIERACLIKENRNYQENLELLVSQRTKELHKVTTAVEQSANSVAIVSTEGIIEYVNPKYIQTTGYSSEEIIGSPSRILSPGLLSDSRYTEMWAAIRAGNEWRGEVCNTTKRGRQYWELCSIAPIRDETGAIINFVAIKEDISDRKQHEEQLYYQANFDVLTGLSNRNYFQKQLEQQLGEMNRDDRFLTLMVLDIDNLKFVNDTFGHEFGDLLLKDVAKRLQAVCGEGHIVSRFVGDEFTIIPLHPYEVDGVVLHAEQVRNAVNTVFVINGIEIITTVSIGVAIYPKDGECVESLLKNAEAAMYQAKKNGKNTVVYYTREFDSRMAHRFAMEAKLHKAIERGEFSLEYQPQIDHARGEIVGVEALLRWTPTGEAPVSPGEFIPVLEESGLIVPVGEWVLWQACTQGEAWRKQGGLPLRISVNISALQFMRSDLDLTVTRVLAATGLDPGCLCLELTESTIMIDSCRTMEKLTALTETGITLSLDDFGTGYSSLEYLGRLPINELKIDISFVRRMLTTRNDAAVVNTIIAMAQGLDMELVAEGVETEEQLAYLVERGCSVIQGYYHSRPLPVEGVAPFYCEWKTGRS